jgi:hypothetical protein
MSLMPYANRADYLAMIERLRRANGMRQCECGCGTEIPALTKALQPARFAPHHRVRVPRKTPGSTLKHSQGYVLEYARDHPRAHNGYVYQHVLVWERHHGSLSEGYVVHHINHVKDDNRLENLHAMPFGDHSRLHMTSERARRMAALSSGRRGKGPSS